MEWMRTLLKHKDNIKSIANITTNNSCIVCFQYENLKHPRDFKHTIISM